MVLLPFGIRGLATTTSNRSVLVQGFEVEVPGVRLFSSTGIAPILLKTGDIRVQLPSPVEPGSWATVWGR